MGPGCYTKDRAARGREAVLTPNFLVDVAMYAWVLVGIACFAVLKPTRALLVVLLGGAMFLPELALVKIGIPLNKDGIVSLVCGLGCLATSGKKIFRAKPFRSVDALILVMMIGGFFTVRSNQDALTYGSWMTKDLPGMTWADAAIGWMVDVLTVATPYVLARSMFRDEEDLKELLSAFAIAGLIYSFFALLETRLSPQLHNWIYGYHQHKFLQTIRWGGFRPMVFMAHGLAVAMFFFAAMTSALVLKKARRSIAGFPAGVVAGFLFMVLILCKSTGAIVYGVAVVPLILASRPKRQLAVAGVVAVLVFAYPALRSLDYFPNDMVLDLANSVSEERGESLAFRFGNEVQLAKKARERMWWGWGGYGRNRIYSDDTGLDISVTDGFWIIQFGGRGLVGMVCSFALMLLPVLIARRKLREIPDPAAQQLVGGLALIVVFFATDLLPNGLYNMLPYFLAAALLGSVQGLVQKAKAAPLAQPARVVPGRSAAPQLPEVARTMRPR